MKKSTITKFILFMAFILTGINCTFAAPPPGGSTFSITVTLTVDETTEFCNDGQVKVQFDNNGVNGANYQIILDPQGAGTVVDAGQFTNSGLYTIGGLDAGDYQIVVTSGLISDNELFTISTLPCDLNVSTSINSPTGSGCDNGSLFVTVSGTSCDGSFYYEVFNTLTNTVDFSGNDGGQGFFEINPFPVGDFILTVMPSNDFANSSASCIYTESVHPSEPACDIDATLVSYALPSSPTASDGSIIVSVSGSACIGGPGGPIFFVGAADQSLNSYPMTQNIDGNYEATGLPQGSYVVVATNNALNAFCFDTVLVELLISSCTIDVGTPVVTAPAGYTQPCNLGSIVVTPTGANPGGPVVVGAVNIATPNNPLLPTSSSGGSYTFANLPPGTYIILVSQGNCSDTAHVNVLPACNIGVSNPVIVNVDNSNATGSYTFTVNTGNGSCDAANASLTGPVNGNLSNLANGSSNTFSNLTPGSYTLTLSIATTSVPVAICTTQVQFDITCSFTDVISTNGSTTFCDGGSVTLSFGNGGYSNYVWSDNSTGATLNVTTGGTYSVTAETSGGCPVSSDGSVTVTVNPNPTVTISPANPSICPGQSITLSSSSSTGNTWSTTETTQSINVNSAGPYSVTVVDNNQCSGTASVTVSQSTACGGSSSLSPASCGNLTFVRTSSIYCVAVTGATGYEWEFADASTPTVVYATHTSTATTIALHNVVPMLNWGTTWSVRVRPLFAATAGTFGNPCIIGIITDPAINGVPVTQLRPQDCSRQNYRINSGNRVIANYVYGANQYEFEFTHVGTSQVHLRMQALNTLYLNQVTPALTAPAQYQVRVRARIGTTWGNFGPICTIGITSVAREGEPELEEQFVYDEQGNIITNLDQLFTLNAMPNPFNNATELVVNCEVNQMVNLDILDISGRIIDSRKVQSNERISVGYELAPGMYLINAITNDGRKATFRLVKSE